jgi:acyl-ACP thioesterase
MRAFNSRREAMAYADELVNDFTADEAEQRRYARMAAQRRLNERLEKRMVVERTLLDAFPQSNGGE